jgi:hypothetical protein
MGRTMANGVDGVRVTRVARVRREVWGVAVVALGLLVGRAVLRSGEPPADSSPPPTPRAAVPTPPAGVVTSSSPAAKEHAPPEEGALPKTMPRSRAGKLRALRALGITPSRGPDGKPQVPAGLVIGALNAAGIHDGIAVFPPPGTDPPRSGIVVPDDWPLPEGYVRHYQSTDDGEPLPPILMFHPDYTFVDEAGNPVAVPEDRIVPPELAPPGLPIRMLEIPAPRDRTR